MNFALLVLTVAPGASAASLGLLASDSAAKKPASLAQSYAVELPILGPLMPKEILREHIRRDVMPRLMSTKDDYTAYKLGLNIFEKIGTRSGSLVELNQKMGSGKKLNKREAKEIMDQHKELSSDLELLGQKIQDDGNNGVPSQTLKLLANSAQGYACAYKATEIAVISQGMERKQDCIMPFPGAFSLLEKKVEVPEKMKLAMPAFSNAKLLQPQEWMTQNMRKVWCPDDEDVMCDAITAALNMPKQDDLKAERESLMQIEEAKAEGKAAPAAMASPMAVPGVGEAVQMEEQAEAEITKTGSTVERVSEELKQQAATANKKVNLLQKREKLRQLKERLAADKAIVSKM